jgi:hypothetical protein
MSLLRIASVITCLMWSVLALTAHEKAKSGAASPVIAACLHAPHVYVLQQRRQDDHLYSFAQRRNVVKSPKEAPLQELRFSFNDQWQRLLHISNDTLFGADGFLHLGVGLNATRLANLPGKSAFEDYDKWNDLRLHPLLCLTIDNAKSLGAKPDLQDERRELCVHD